MVRSAKLGLALPGVAGSSACGQAVEVHRPAQSADEFQDGRTYQANSTRLDSVLPVRK